MLKIPLIHVNVNFNFPNRLARFMKKLRLPIVEKDVVECKFWADFLGLRDMHLHGQGVVEMETEW